MNRIRWTALSLGDLQNISLYIEGQRDLETANRVCRSIYDSVQQLRHFSGAGKQGMEEGTREFVVADFPAYIIVYRISNEAVEILRIWHGSQERPR